MKTVTIIVTGHVQGVFFRDFAVSSAHALGVTGWVRNRRDGSVEARATGTEDALAKACRPVPRQHQWHQSDVVI